MELRPSDIVRLGLIMAVCAEVEAYKIANGRRDMRTESAIYDEAYFFEAAETLRQISRCKDEDL